MWLASVKLGILVTIACAGIASGSVIVPQINAYFGPTRDVTVPNFFVSAPVPAARRAALTPSHAEVEFSPASGSATDDAADEATAPGSDFWATGPEVTVPASDTRSPGCPVETGEGKPLAGPRAQHDDAPSPEPEPGSAALGGIRADAVLKPRPGGGDS